MPLSKSGRLVVFRVGLEEDSDSSEECQNSQPSNTTRKTPQHKFRVYKLPSSKNDLKVAGAMSKFLWIFPTPKASDQKSPVYLFELFFILDRMEHICKVKNMLLRRIHTLVM